MAVVENLLDLWRERCLELAVGLWIVYFSWVYVSSPDRKLNAECVCWPSPFKWIDFVLNGRRRLFFGYEKHVRQSGSFTVPYLGNTTVVVTGNLVQELCTAAEEDLSLNRAVSDLYLIKYTFGPDLTSDPLFVDVMKRQLPRTVNEVLPNMIDEGIYAIDHLLDIKPDQGWVKVPARDVLAKILSAASNRTFFGLPACRSAELRDLQVDYRGKVVLASTLTHLFPSFLHPIIGPLLSPAKPAIKIVAKYVAPIMAERKQMDPASRPNDMISWFMNYSEAHGTEMTLEEICLRILSLGIAANYNAGTSLTQAVYHLAARRMIYLIPLREEIQAAVARHGWTRAALGEMKKVESFIKEVNRWSVANAAIMVRKAMRDYTFSDGTFVPKGYLTCALSIPVYHDETIYPNADKFDGFRFLNYKPPTLEPSVTQPLTAANPNDPAFGSGVHICPGRFLAAYELKFILAYLIMNYDLRMEEEGLRPPDFWLGSRCFPNATAEVMFRRTEDS